MSVLQMSRVFRLSASKGSARLVLLALADVASDEGEVIAYPRSHKILAGKANVDQGSVRRAIDKLEELGELEILKLGDGRKPSDYRIILPEPANEGRQDEGPQPAGPGAAGCAPRGGEVQAQGAQDAAPITPSLLDPPPSPSTSGSAALSEQELARLFEIFWKAYPRRTAKPTALKAWPGAVKRAGSTEKIIAGAERYAREKRGSEARYMAHPASWLNADRWDDEPGSNSSGARSGGPRGPIEPSAAPEGRVQKL